MANTARLNDVVIVTPGFSAARVTEAGQDIVTIDGLLLVVETNSRVTTHSHGNVVHTTPNMRSTIQSHVRVEGREVVVNNDPASCSDSHVVVATGFVQILT